MWKWTMKRSPQMKKFDSHPRAKAKPSNFQVVAAMLSYERCVELGLVIEKKLKMVHKNYHCLG